MAKAKERTRKAGKLGRNDPCWCGSGIKYKDCHLASDEEQRAEQRKLRQASDTLLPRIFQLAESVPHAFPPALELFWGGKYSVEQMADLDDLEDRGAERFLTWFAFDCVLYEGHTLVSGLQQQAETGDFEAPPHEQHLLRLWRTVRLRPYAIAEVHKGSGLLVHDLLNDAPCTVEDRSASRRLAVGDVLVGHLLPLGEPTPQPATEQPAGAPPPPEQVYQIAGAMALLTSETRDALVEFAHLHLADLRRSQPDATLEDLVQQRSYIFNQFVSALPREQTPGIADDVLLRTRVALQMAGVPVPGQSSAPADPDTPESEDEDEPNAPTAAASSDENRPTETGPST
jgi:hypothetical protein